MDSRGGRASGSWDGRAHALGFPSPFPGAWASGWRRLTRSAALSMCLKMTPWMARLGKKLVERRW